MLMRYTKLTDIAIHILLPLCIGVAIYAVPATMPLAHLLKNHLPDALWMYAFISTFFIIWQRNPPLGWIIIACGCAIAFELLQYVGLINGTCDVWDMFAYLLSAGVALIINRSITNNNHLKPNLNPRNKCTDPEKIYSPL